MDRLNPAAAAAVRQIAAAANNAAARHRATAIDVALEIADLARYLDTVFAATVYRGRLESVRRVKADRDKALPGKAEITYRRADNGDELESIETDWLTGREALDIAKRAQAGVGRMATFYKNNDDDPDGKRSAGFRRVVWLVVDEGDA